MSAQELYEQFNIKLKDLKENSQLSINYVGAIYGSEKNELLNNSDIFVLPSKYRTEAQPISIIEAMAAGNVIITTNHNLLPEIVKDHVNGILVEPGVAGQICQAIIFAVDNPDWLKEVSCRNQLEVRNKYTFDNHVKSVINVLRETK